MNSSPVERTRLRRHKQVRDPHVEPLRELFERLERGIAGSDLDAGDVAAIQADLFGQAFLGPPTGMPERSDALA